MVMVGVVCRCFQLAFHHGRASAEGKMCILRIAWELFEGGSLWPVSAKWSNGRAEHGQGLKLRVTVGWARSRCMRSLTESPNKTPKLAHFGRHLPSLSEAIPSLVELIPKMVETSPSFVPHRCQSLGYRSGSAVSNRPTPSCERLPICFVRNSNRDSVYNLCNCPCSSLCTLLFKRRNCASRARCGLCERLPE